MIRLLIRAVPLLVAASVLPGCGGDLGGPAPAPVIPPTTSLSFDFARGAQGWSGGFADLPVDYARADFNLVFREAALPAPLDTSRRALLLGGTNRSDDLWMFLKRRVTGLRPNTRYRIGFEVEFATNAPSESVGVGGSPGSSVFVKVGASPVEPRAVVQGTDLRLNIDKGEQAQSGAAAVTIGDVGISGEEFVYRFKSLTTRGSAVTATSDATGGLWILVGTDSGFEARTELFYTRVAVSLDAS